MVDKKGTGHTTSRPEGIKGFTWDERGWSPETTSWRKRVRVEVGFIRGWIKRLELQRKNTFNMDYRNGDTGEYWFCSRLRDKIRSINEHVSKYYSVTFVTPLKISGLKGFPTRSGWSNYSLTPWPNLKCSPTFTSQWVLHTSQNLLIHL